MKPPYLSCRYPPIQLCSVLPNTPFFVLRKGAQVHCSDGDESRDPDNVCGNEILDSGECPVQQAARLAAEATDLRHTVAQLRNIVEAHSAMNS